MIPNIVHFNYGLMEQEKDFLFVYYIAVLSCKLINNPEKIYFHYHYEPKGCWWEKTKELVDIIKIDIPLLIGTKQLKKVAHKSDIARKQQMNKRRLVKIWVHWLNLQCNTKLLMHLKS